MLSQALLLLQPCHHCCLAGPKADQVVALKGEREHGALWDTGGQTQRDCPDLTLVMGKLLTAKKSLSERAKFLSLYLIFVQHIALHF